MRRNASIDWTIRENVRAKLRVAVKRILRKYGYPPDMQEKATRTVIEQAELICRRRGVADPFVPYTVASRSGCRLMFRSVATPESPSKNRN